MNPENRVRPRRQISSNGVGGEQTLDDQMERQIPSSNLLRFTTGTPYKTTPCKAVKTLLDSRLNADLVQPTSITDN